MTALFIGALVVFVFVGPLVAAFVITLSRPVNWGRGS